MHCHRSIILQAINFVETFTFVNLRFYMLFMLLLALKSNESLFLYIVNITTVFATRFLNAAFYR